MRGVLLFLTLSWFTFSHGQTIQPLDIQPDSSNYENIYVKKIAEDSLQSTYIIWVKHQVKAHYHEAHSEIIEVLSGTGNMTIADKTFAIKRGDFFTIPIGSVHSVTTTSAVPLKVISIQSPRFNGDRIWVNPN